MRLNIPGQPGRAFLFKAAGCAGAARSTTSLHAAGTVRGSGQARSGALQADCAEDQRAWCVL